LGGWEGRRERWDELARRVGESTTPFSSLVLEKNERNKIESNPIELIAEPPPRLPSSPASLSDASLLTSLASKADVIINAADCDDLISTNALIAGLEQAAEARIANKQLKAVYLHTSGTGELVDPEIPLGTLDETVYDDMDLEQIVASELRRDEIRCGEGGRERERTLLSRADFRLFFLSFFLSFF